MKKKKKKKEKWKRKKKEYNMKNIFLEKSYTKWDTETSPSSFLKKLNLSISLD